MWRRVGGCSSDSVRRDGGGLLWGGKMEMEKGRVRELEWKGKMVENGWFWGKKRNHYDAQNPVWPGRKGGAICRDKKPTECRASGLHQRPHWGLGGEVQTGYMQVTGIITGANGHLPCLF